MMKSLCYDSNQLITATPKRTDEMNLIICSIITISKQNRKSYSSLDPNLEKENWPSTREISEYCQFSIYKTRHILIKLLDASIVISSVHKINNSLRWYLHKEVILSLSGFVSLSK